MDQMQHSLIAEYLADERHAQLLGEAAGRRRARLAQPDYPWRERLARRLVAAALRVAPGDSALRHRSGALRMLAQE